MNKSPDLDAWNYQVLMFNQAMLGGISPNFRMVTLSYSNDEWILSFFLEQDVAEDIEEIEEIVTQYTAYQDSNLNCRSEILTGNGKLDAPKYPARVVFRRRENS
jgi:hypothetical protein